MAKIKKKSKEELDKEFEMLYKEYSKNGVVEAMPIMYNDLDDRFYDDSDLELYDDYEEDEDPS